MTTAGQPWLLTSEGSAVTPRGLGLGPFPQQQPTSPRAAGTHSDPSCRPDMTAFCGALSHAAPVFHVPCPRRVWKRVTSQTSPHLSSRPLQDGVAASFLVLSHFTQHELRLMERAPLERAQIGDS